jgi:SNF2 family DNA or RNA helicase
MYLLEAATNPGLLTAGSSGDDPRFFRHPPLPVAADSPLAELLARYAAHETPSKFVALAQLLARNRQEGRKTLVWSSFVRNLELLRGELASLGPAVVHGGVPLGAEAIGISTREQELARFREDPDCWVLLANPAALGEGISLHTVCHDAVYLERTFNAGQYLQSIDRIHRLGLAPEVETRVTFLVTPGTIDGAVAERVAKKAELMGQMLDDTDIATLSLPDEEDIGAPFDLGDRGDVEALFDHLAGDE